MLYRLATWSGRATSGRSKHAFASSTRPMFFSSKRKKGPEESTTALFDQMVNSTLEHDEQPLGEEGVVISTKGQLVSISGLRDASKGSAVNFESGGSAFVFDLRETEVSAAIMHSPAEAGRTVKRGDRVIGTVDSVLFPVGSATAGRVLDGLGNPIDGKGPLKPKDGSGETDVIYERSLVSRVPGIVARGPTNMPFFTGIKKLDIFAPIARGQRCAFLGVSGTGKTTTALNALINHAKSDPEAHCVYAAVSVSHPPEPVVRLLEKEGVMDQFTLVMASKSDSEASKYLALYGACAVAESFGNEGRHAAIVYDELLAHAYSLVNLGQLTGMAMHDQTRYLHSNLLERACSLGSKRGGGSVTALALVDTPDVSSHGSSAQFSGDATYRMACQTGDTVSSIVDRTVRFDTNLARNGEWPAIELTRETQMSESLDQTSYTLLIPSLAGQARPLHDLSTALYHMQVAAREAFRSTEEMSKFGLDPYEEGRIAEARRMKYWSKVEAMLLTHPALRGSGDKHHNGSAGAHEAPQLKSMHQGFPSMNRVTFARLYLSLLAAACGKLEMIPIHSIPEFEQSLWEYAEADSRGICEELEALDWSQEMDPAVSKHAMTVVDQFLPDYINSLGMQAMGEHLVPQEAR